MRRLWKECLECDTEFGSWEHEEREICEVCEAEDRPALGWYLGTIGLAAVFVLALFALPALEEWIR